MFTFDDLFHPFSSIVFLQAIFHTFSLFIQRAFLCFSLLTKRVRVNTDPAVAALPPA